MDGFDQYERFFELEPYLVDRWEDAETGAVGWLVIDSLRGGAAGGGTRMRKGGTAKEAGLLAKTMGIKFTVAGPDIGGAKSVIDFNPDDPRKEGVLRRWFHHITPHLQRYYGTGSDLNTDEVEVIDLLDQARIVGHPQEGIVRGHYARTYTPEAGAQAIEQLRNGVKLRTNVPGLGEKIAGDLVTGWGVVRALHHYYVARGESLEGKRVLLQGFGNVGEPAAHYLDEHGALVVGISAAGEGGLQFAHNPDGLAVADEIADRTDDERKHLSTARWKPGADDVDAFWDTPADAFIPAAGSDLVTKDHVDRLVRAGVRVISCGANGPFEGASGGGTEALRYADDRLAVIPDFIANCGAARVFAYLMQATEEVAAAVEDAVTRADARAFLDDVDRTVERALRDVFAFAGGAPETGLTEHAYRVFVPRAEEGRG
jgi:glutamate dehydrogenase/leucine dehydrogenase